jgi:tRNA A-37 threonylcarbamoyl transferase component Bud32
MAAEHKLNLFSPTISLPFTLELNSGNNPEGHSQQSASLECTEILRSLPGRRLVCRGTYCGQQVLAKLFIHPHKAERDYKQELSGYKYLTQTEITTPQLINSGNISAVGYYILYHYLENARPLEQKIAPLSPDIASTYIAQLMAIIATMHSANFQQIDLHLNNFLWSNDKLYTIDCGDIAPLSNSKQKKAVQIHRNIADVLSQLPLHYDPLIPAMLAQYQQQMQENIQISVTKINKHIDRWRQWRMRNYLKKAARNCSEFLTITNWHKVMVCRREYSSAAWLEFYANLDQTIENATRLKSGNTATVTLAECNGIKVVIKRYNIKNFRHWISRFWRPSRGWKSWQNAHRLKVLGIKTPKPIAVIEQRWGWLRYRAYYLTEYNPALDALTMFTQQPAVSDEQLIAFKQLFTAMIYARISHGDFKGNNILVDNNNLALIDLDSMYFHRFRHSFAKAFTKDLQRLQRNWSNNTNVTQQFTQLIKEIYPA